MQEISQGKALTKAGGQERLFSFYMEGTNVKPKDIWIFNRKIRRRNANK